MSQQRLRGSSGSGLVVVGEGVAVGVLRGGFEVEVGAGDDGAGWGEPVGVGLAGAVRRGAVGSPEAVGAGEPVPGAGALVVPGAGEVVPVVLVVVVVVGAVPVADRSGSAAWGVDSGVPRGVDGEPGLLGVPEAVESVFAG